jgi:aryl-alcohol dehydrogenase-like predicted oxidoreductase
MHYSLVGRDVERDVVPMMARYGLGMTVWSPLASGFLSGKVHAGEPGGFRQPPLRLRHHALRQGARLRAGRAHARDGGRARRSVAQLAVAWLLAKPGVTSVILGATKPHQLADNLGAADLALPAEEVAALDELTTPSEVYPNWFIERLVDAKQKEALGAR